MVNNYKIIELYRESLGLDQVTFAEKLGVHRNTISRWETGKALDYEKVIRKISRVFPNFKNYIDDLNGERAVTDSSIREPYSIGEPPMTYVVFEDERIKQYVVNKKQYRFIKDTRETFQLIESDDGRDMWVIVPTENE